MSVTTRIFAACLALSLAFPAIAQDTDELSAETVVATVNGTDITLGHMVALRVRIPPQYQQMPPEVLFSFILDQLIQQELLASTEDSLTPGGQIAIDNETRAIKANQAISGVIEEEVTDEALQQVYQEAFTEADPATEFNASHILVETEEEALGLVEELSGGADFAALAQEKSTGPSGPNGGALGWFASGDMVAPFEAAVAAMEVGAISAPVQTQFGWHVILLNETRLAEAPPFEAVRAELAQELERAAIEKKIAELTEAGDIDRTVADGLDPAVLSNPDLIPQ